jgi:hypothetical protein
LKLFELLAVFRKGPPGSVPALTEQSDECRLFPGFEGQEVDEAVTETEFLNENYGLRTGNLKALATTNISTN